jgi:phosphatidate cytidylyltransferase
MALNIPTFKTRALTAFFFALLMLAGVLWNQWSFFILFSIIHFGCWYEYQKLISFIDPDYNQITRFHKYGVMIAGWCIMLYCTNVDYRVGNLNLQEIGLWGGLFFMFVLPIVEILFVRKINFKNIGYSALGLLYISLSLGLFTNLRSIYLGGALDIIDKMLVLMVILSIWINDTMAYLAGSLIGRTPLSSISPKKTWEGTISGIILSILIMGAVGYFVNSQPDWELVSQWMILAAIASVFGTLGDLLESKLKRMANVKDSGLIMPGHGGFLDRFDSLLLAAPFVWLYVEGFLK